MDGTCGSDACRRVGHEFLRRLFGTVELVMHQGAVVQIETAEKFRLD